MRFQAVWTQRAELQAQPGGRATTERRLAGQRVAIGEG